MSQPELFSLVEFGDRLRAARKQRGLNQSQFARLGDVGLQSQSRYEQALTEPGISYLASLARHEVDVAWILTGQHSVESLDGMSSAVVSGVRKLAPEHQAALLAFLAALNTSPALPRSSASVLPSETALADALGAFLEATPGLGADELAQELAMQLPIILQAASGEAGSPRSARPETPPARPAAEDADHRAPRRGRRS